MSYETRKLWHYIPEESLPLDTQVSFNFQQCFPRSFLFHCLLLDQVTSVDVPALATAEFARGDWLKVTASCFWLRQELKKSQCASVHSFVRS